MHKIVKIFGIVFLVTLLSFFFHELFHWVAYELLGYKAGFSLNYAAVKDKELILSYGEKLVSSAAGPIFTILQAVICYYLLKSKDSIVLYIIMFAAFVQRLMAGIFNIFQPNDEGRISLALGLPLFTISTVVVCFLFYLVYKTSKEKKYTVKDNALFFIYSIVAITTIVFVDNQFTIQFV
ncbi:hypothetical protein [Kangiella sp. HZ709]|uniref:hypothetical protein n=1 Tax=Kangiella sp. HZ709 TaxID=2666328 RepID=UPI0012AFCB2D|nr:hypothetical protein [Kangiella sp. HZ709]MRX26556.1 hypothetical protein [Kangiella sp. HZ709]